MSLNEPKMNLADPGHPADPLEITGFNQNQIQRRYLDEFQGPASEHLLIRELHLIPLWSAARHKNCWILDVQRPSKL